MEILYVSSVPSRQEFYRMKTMLKDNINIAPYGMNEAGFKFHSLILEGLSYNSDVHLLSLIGRSASNKTHKGFYWKARKEQGENRIRYKHVGFINLPIAKQLTVGIAFFFSTLRWLMRHAREKDKYIITDASYVTSIPFVLLATKLIPCKKAAVFCDIYEYMAEVKDARGNEHVSMTHRFFRNLMSNMYRQLDGFIILTEKMNEVVNPLAKPSLVIEGLADLGMRDVQNTKEAKSPYDVVMYAGALREQYGLKNLVDGFMDYQNDNARLWIFGAGDYIPFIQAAAQKDARIFWGGTVNQDDVVKKELEARVLVNPRPADRQFTQYSFPSKNMEYMASGTPILTTRLPGMPDEYYDYIYTIDGNDADSIAKALHNVFSHTKDELHLKGKKAKKFILENKNNKIQSEKILNLLQGL